MDGFEAHGYFELAGYFTCELKAALTYEGGVAFDDDSFEGCCLLRDGVVVFGRDGVGIEEAAAVVELDLTGWGELGEGVGDLLRGWLRWVRFR